MCSFFVLTSVPAFLISDVAGKSRLELEVILEPQHVFTMEKVLALRPHFWNSDCPKLLYLLSYQCTRVTNVLSTAVQMYNTPIPTCSSVLFKFLTMHSILFVMSVHCPLLLHYSTVIQQLLFYCICCRAIRLLTYIVSLLF